MRCSSRMPPWPCTIAFGSPVVPEVYSTHSGWSNGTCSNASVAPAPAASRSSQGSGPRPRERAGRDRGSRTTACSTVGSAAHQLRTTLAAVEVLAAVPVAVDREQDARLDLREAVDHAARRRTPASSSTRSRRSRRTRGTPRPPRGCSGGTRRRGRPAPRRARAGRRRSAPPRLAELTSSSAPPGGRSSEAWRIATASVARARSACSAKLRRAPGEPLRPRHRPRAEHALVRRRRR